MNYFRADSGLILWAIMDDVRSHSAAVFEASVISFTDVHF